MKNQGRHKAFDMIAFDADDTLWHNEILYDRAQDRLEELLSAYCHGDGIRDELYKTEKANIRVFGYGIKSFALSMVETAIRLCGDRIKAADIQEIVDLAKEMRCAPVQLLDYVADVIPVLAASYRLMVITKGDSFEQEAKMARSGLAPYFTHVEVLSEKTEEAYRSLLARVGIDPWSLLMVGNSLRSDVLPVVALGGHAVYIPYAITWQHEVVPARAGKALGGYVQLENLGLLPDLVGQLEQQLA